MNISVVIPILNESDSILLLLEALANQDHLPTEVLVIDGGSTDESILIIEQYKKRNANIGYADSNVVFAAVGEITATCVPDALRFAIVDVSVPSTESLNALEWVSVKSIVT